MTESAPESLETILRQVEASAPEPWYPKLYAETTGVPRDSLDPPLEKLRMAGLIRLTEWVKDRGQGYVLTPEGIQALKSERELARLRDGRIVPPARVARKPREFPEETPWDRGERIREAFLNPPKPVVTRFVLFVYLGVFLVGLFFARQANVPMHLYLYGTSEDGIVQRALHEILVKLGAVYPAGIVRGEWWRLITACFVHIGIVHLALNCWGLHALGGFLEPLLGSVRLAVLYLLAGLGGSSVSLVITPVTAAGGSGALCGMLGAIAVWLVFNRAHLPTPVAAALQRNIMTNIILMVFISFFPGVGWAGHLGGAVFGVITAVLLHYQGSGSGAVRWLAAAGLALVPLIAIGALWHTMNTQARWVQLKEAIRADEAHEELVSLRQRYRRDAEPADTAARQAYPEVYNVVKNHPSRRDPQDKQHALEILSQVRADLVEAIRKLSAGPAHREASVEEARQGVIEYLQARADLCALCEKFLREDSNLLDGNLKALEEQEAKVKELQRVWFHRER